MAIRTRILCGSIGIGRIAIPSLLLVRNRFVLATAAAAADDDGCMDRQRDPVPVAVPVDITASFLLLLLLLLMVMMVIMMLFLLMIVPVNYGFLFFIISFFFFFLLLVVLFLLVLVVFFLCIFLVGGVVIIIDSIIGTGFSCWTETRFGRSTIFKSFLTVLLVVVFGPRYFDIALMIIFVLIHIDDPLFQNRPRLVEFVFLVFVAGGGNIPDPDG